MKYSHRILICSMLFGLSACKAQFENSELIGIYKANHNRGEDIVILNKDGKYSHTFKTSGKLFERKGAWEYEIFEDQPLISFYNFDHRWSDSYTEEKGERNVWPAFIERTIFGKIRLGLDDDLGFYYEKID